jgi:hypothetical protein
VDNFKVSFDDSALKELQRKSKELDGEREVPLIELLTDSFLHKYTNFQTLQAMVDTSGIKNLEEIGKENFSKFVSTHTRFGNWDEMLKEAGAEYIKRKLGL